MGDNFCSACGAVLQASDADPITITFFPDSSDSSAVETPTSRGSVAVLVANRGPNTGSRYELVQGTTSLGRHPNSDIFLDDITVSRRHAEIVRTDDEQMVIRDIGSLNGTYVNLERVDESVLHDGDEVQVGTFKLTFVDADPTGPGGEAAGDTGGGVAS